MLKRTSRSFRRLFVVCLAAIAVFSMAVPADAATNDEKAVAWRVNHEHYTRQYRQLSSWESLVGVARNHSCTMARAGKLYHNTNLTRQIPRGWRIAGENVAVGYDLYQIHKAWMNSPAHRDNILERRYTAIGSGVCRDAGGAYWVTTVFYG